MTKNKAFVLIVFFSFLSAVTFYILGAWHSNKVNQQELKKFIEQDRIADQEREEAYLGIISRYVIITDQQETIIRELQTKEYVEPEDMDLLRPSREE